MQAGLQTSGGALPEQSNSVMEIKQRKNAKMPFTTVGRDTPIHMQYHHHAKLCINNNREDGKGRI